MLGKGEAFSLASFVLSNARDSGAGYYLRASGTMRAYNEGLRWVA